MSDKNGALRAGTLAELKDKGHLVVSGSVPIAVFYNDGDVRAIDNRCPHMGFPMHQGTVQDGIVTCHWHHARFDLNSGCTFDLWADDLDAYPVEVRDGDVFVMTEKGKRNAVEHGKRRLLEGMQQNLRLVIAKSVVNLLNAKVNPNEIAKIGGLYGVRNRRSGWSSGLTILTAMANVTDHLKGDERIAPLYQGLVHVARDCANQPPKFDLFPLETADVDLATLKRWFRKFVEVRDPDGAERCLLTAIQQGASDADLADLMGAAVTDHLYLDGGHTLDFLNKAFELLDRIGWDQAGDVLPSMVRQICGARRAEEINAWRHPIDLVPFLKVAFDDLPNLLKKGEGKTWTRSDGFVETLLNDDPQATVLALSEAIANGATPVELARVVAYVAALRIARFHVQNEFGDWIAVLHTFTYSNGLHQLLKRTPSVDLLRGVFHGALRVYLDRFLNIPPARLPKDNGKVVNGTFQGEFLDLLNNQQQTDEAGQQVFDYLNSGNDPQQLFRILAESLLREDAEFHSFQVLEAAIRQFGEATDVNEQRLILVAAARYLAAHAPTQREMRQTMRIALRLHRGDPVYEEE